MPHFVCTFVNQNNQAAEIRVIETNAAMMIINTPQPFHREADAVAYKRQLEEHYGIAPQQPAKASGKRKSVKHWQSGEVFTSAAAAARSLGVSTSAITRHLREPVKFQQVRGQTYSYITDINQ